MQILIITNGPLTRNPRVVKEASTLGNAGHHVTVFTQRNHAPSETYDTAIMREAPFRRVPIDFIPGYSLSRQQIFFRLLPHRIARKAMRYVGYPSLSAVGPVGPIFRAALAHPADLTIVHNEVPHGIGIRLMRQGRRVAADLEDWHSEDLLPETRKHRPLELLRQQERILLQKAAYTITTSEALADALHERYQGRRPTVLTNSFPLGPYRNAGSTSVPPRLLWFSQTIGPGRGLEAFLAGWKYAQTPSELMLLGEDPGDYASRLRESLPMSHQSRLQSHPLVAPADLPSFIAKYDIGLALEPDATANGALTISNKILQYLNAGLAVIASDTPGQREVMARSASAGVLIQLSKPLQIATKLNALLADPIRLAQSQTAARQLAESHYCWERESPRLLELVNQAIQV